MKNPTFDELKQLASARRIRGVHRGDDVALGAADIYTHDTLGAELPRLTGYNYYAGTYDYGEAFFIERLHNGEVIFEEAHTGTAPRFGDRIPFSPAVQQVIDDLKMLMGEHHQPKPAMSSVSSYAVPRPAYAETWGD